MTVTEFLLARIAEDEYSARDDTGWASLRILRDCEAKRRIIDLCAKSFTPGSAEIKSGMSATQTMAWLTLIYLCLPYADHPDYSEEWRP